MSDLRVADINRFCCGGFFVVVIFFSGLCDLSLGFNTENDNAPVGLTPQGIDRWVHLPVGSSVC